MPWPDEVKGSIVQSGEKCCFLCGRRTQLEKHHIMSGPNRRLAEKYGIWCFLCASCHRGVDGAQYNSEVGDRLKQIGQTAFEKIYSHAFWMELFRKNYL